MSIKRIKELQDYANDFYKKLQASEESLPTEEEKIILPYNKIIKKSCSTKVPTKKASSFSFKKSFSNYNIINSKNKLKPIVKRNDSILNGYNTITPWIPPQYNGDYFENYKRLQDHYDMSNWEKVYYYYLIFKFLVSNSFM